jgi:hypothetical protein
MLAASSVTVLSLADDAMLSLTKILGDLMQSTARDSSTYTSGFNKRYHQK